MWSGPRNISTALMRSWGNRADTVVWDEPLYAHYLSETGLDHPGRDEVISRHEADWRKVIQGLVGRVPGGKSIFYQKHMAHHLLPHIDRGWLGHVTNAFLIRDPREMITSLAKVLPAVRLVDTGLPQQVEIFDLVRRQTGLIPPVIDSKDVLDNPRRVLSILCERLELPFDEAMLSWPPGPRETDGIWAKHWYHQVEQTTTFQPFQPKNEQVPAGLGEILSKCIELYQRLHIHRLIGHD
jgi:hypothetical protein